MGHQEGIERRELLVGPPNRAWEESHLPTTCLLSPESDGCDFSVALVNGGSGRASPTSHSWSFPLLTTDHV